MTRSSQLSSVLSIVPSVRRPAWPLLSCGLGHPCSHLRIRGPGGRGEGLLSWGLESLGEGLATQDSQVAFRERK